MVGVTVVFGIRGYCFGKESREGEILVEELADFVAGVGEVDAHTEETQCCATAGNYN